MILRKNSKVVPYLSFILTFLNTFFLK